MKNIKETLSIHYTKLSNTDKMIFQKIISEPQHFINLSIHEVAKILNTSSPTILRATKKIGYSGYPEFKLALKEYVASTEQNQKNDEHSLIATIVDTYERSFDLLVEENLGEEVLEVIQWIKEACDVKTIGIGNSSLPALQLVYSLYSQNVFFEAITTDTQVYFLKQAMRKNQLFIIYSVSGLDFYRDFIKVANKVGAKTVVITMNPDAKINSQASKTIILPMATTIINPVKSLRQLDMRLELFLFSEIVSYYYDVGNSSKQ